MKIRYHLIHDLTTAPLLGIAAKHLAVVALSGLQALGSMVLLVLLVLLMVVVVVVVAEVVVPPASFSSAASVSG